MTRHRSRALFALVLIVLGATGAARGQERLPGTAPLTWEDDIASRLVDGVDRFLLRELEESVGRRSRHWNRDFQSSEAYNQSVAPNRERLRRMLGLRDAAVSFDALELIATSAQPAELARTGAYRVLAVRWPVVAELRAEGLLLEPLEGREIAADVVAIPDADQTPELLAGLAPGLAPEEQLARRLAESGCRVLIPTLVDRRLEKRNGRANLTSREYLYRSAFELGRQLLGYELQGVLNGADWLSRDSERGGAPARTLAVVGWGEGGWLALYAAALETRIDAALVSGCFDSRSRCWDEPIDRNVFGLLDEFGGAELATLVAPRRLVIEAARGPQVELPSEGGAPAKLGTPPLDEVRREVERARQLLDGAPESWPRPRLIVSGDGDGGPGRAPSLSEILAPHTLVPSQTPAIAAESVAADLAQVADERQQRLLRQYDRHNQELLVESPYVRAEFLRRLDTSSPEAYARTVEEYRTIFRDQVVGRFEREPLPFSPRSRRAYDQPRWTGYEVVLDVFPDVFAYGILLVPKGIPEGERRPVVVCQHGLEGRPQDIVTGDHPAYHDFAAQLAERGFVTFAPQNLYIFKDRFRTLQRKANPLGKTLFSVIVPQHQQIVDWLQTLPYVDPERIAFYGLSYGGKSAMRIPPLVTDYCLSICSADFNEWVWKNASSRAPQSYVWTGEYEIFEFDLGSTFNYSEMAALIAPRPFMVERGHFDGVAPDETVGYEFAKVRHLYQARLGIGDRCEIEWFVGPHTINGQGTFAFLHKHLRWPEK